MEKVILENVEQEKESLEIDQEDNRDMITRINSLCSDGIIMDEEECHDFLRFLAVFSVGCCKQNIQNNVFSKALPLFTAAMSKMGYGFSKINSLVKASCTVYLDDVNVKRTKNHK